MKFETEEDFYKTMIQMADMFHTNAELDWTGPGWYCSTPIYNESGTFIKYKVEKDKNDPFNIF